MTNYIWRTVVGGVVAFVCVSWVAAKPLQNRAIPPNSDVDPVRALCKANEQDARSFCLQVCESAMTIKLTRQTPREVKPEHLTPCTAFVRTCMRYYFDDAPMERAASLFSSYVGIDKSVGVSGIPFYPFNKEGQVTAYKSRPIDFGTWGARVGDNRGVSNFYDFRDEKGANWYQGHYVDTNMWQVPIIPWIQGSSGPLDDASPHMIDSRCARHTCPSTSTSWARQSR